MPVNRQTVRELSRTTLYNITSSGQAWRAFLDAAARLYKYSFPEQVLIYAQEPEATACAAKEVWYTRMKRSLRPDAQAIALPDPHSHFGRLKYVFDVRETQPLPGAPEFRQWSLPFEALERVTDRLGQEYGISREPVVADRVYALVMNAPRELYPMQLTAMLRAADAEGRWSGQDDAALARLFHQLVADSAAYMAGVRVGIGTGAVTSDALESITRFNSSGLAALAGTYASRLAASVLRDVERAARENDRLAFPARGVQNEGREEFSHAAEAAKEVQDNDIYNTERSALPGPDAGGTGGSTGQIRPAAPPIPGEKRPRPAEHPAAGGRAEQPSGADRPSGARAGGADDGASGTAHKAAGQTDGPAWLGRDDEQPAPAGGGNGDGADLRQLSLFPAEEEIQETGRSGTERPVSLSPDEIDDILRCDREYKKGYKKEDLFLYTKLRNVAGVAQTEAKKSSDLFAKCQYLDELTGGRGVVFATGTPISNSMAELYTMMRYLQYGMLQDRGLTLFDEWASTFGEVTTSVELKPEGTGYRMRTRFSRFYNLPELMALWREAADIQTADMLNLPVPEAERKNVVVKPTDIQREMVAELGERAEAVRNGNVDPSEDNMLTITNDGRKLALDQRLIDPLLPDEAGSKVNASVEEVFRLWQEFASTKGTQLVFCDLSTPKAEKKIKCMTDGVAAVQAAAFSVYADVRDKLIGHGVPPGEIAFIHDADNEKKKAELFAKVRSGKVRILLGSTQKMGAGTNVQTLLAAEHHLDVPWRPSDIEQREGRAIRQGNTNKKVFIHRYVTEGTFDAYSWVRHEVA